MTATEQVVEVQTPTLVVQPAEVGLKRSASAAANATKWLTKNQMVLAPCRRK